MAVSTITNPTLAEMARSVDPGWKEVLPVIELLSLRHGLMSAIGFDQANGAVSHRTQVRTGLPTPTWRMFNRGVPATNDQTANVTFSVALLKDVVEVDAELLKIAPNKERYMLQRAAAHLEGMAQEWSSTAFYGTAATPEEFVGLASMYSDTTANNGRNVLDAGGIDASDNTSIYLINSGPTVFGTYPMGTPAGISRSGGGEVWSESLGGSGLRGFVWREEYTLGGGLVVEDWRDVVRIGSIDVSAMVAQSGDANLNYWTTKAAARMISRPTYNRFWVMNATTFEYLVHQRNDRQVAGGGVQVSSVDGVGMSMSLHGYPVVIDDNILNTEAAV